MTSTQNDFHKPPHWQNPEGDPRKVGFEFELASTSLDACAELVVGQFGGNINHKHSLEATIEDTKVGSFKVELDAHIVKKIAENLEKEDASAEEELIDMNALRGQVSQWIGDAAGKIVPLEIVTPPLPFEQFEKLETLRESLQKEKAEGTRAAFLNAFGLHINPEIYSDDVREIRDVLRAFLILYPWLKERMQIDPARRIVTYIDPFPEAYVRLILDPDYDPLLGAFIEDYLDHNPTRNRTLDMLPLFAHLKPESIEALDESDRKLVKARPTFHYRLPNCEIDDPDWRIARDWNYWVEVEKLADNKQRLKKMSEKYLSFLDKPFHIFSRDWVKQTSEILEYDE